MVFLGLGKAGVKTDSWREAQTELLKEAQALALIGGLLHNLSETTDLKAAVNAFHRDLAFLFQLRSSLFFLYDRNQSSLRAISASHDYHHGFLRQMTIPLALKDSLLVKALSSGKVCHSPGSPEEKSLILADEQIQRLLGEEVLCALPLNLAGSQFGVLALGLRRDEAASLLEDGRGIRRFASQAAAALSRFQNRAAAQENA